MSSIDISAVDVDASSGSSWDGSDSELEVQVTHVVQQQKEEEEEEEELDLELDESHKSSKTSPLPTKPAGGLPKGPSPRPAVQKTIVNFFLDATVTVAQTQSTTFKKKTTAEKRMEKRQQEVEEAAAYPTAPARAPHIEKTRVIRLHKDRRKGVGRDREAEKEEEVGVGGKRNRHQLTGSKKTQSKGRVSARQRIEQFLEEVDGKIICRACQNDIKYGAVVS